MSWLSDIAGRAETLLNQIDQNAATVLKEGNNGLGHDIKGREDDDDNDDECKSGFPISSSSEASSSGPEISGRRGRALKGGERQSASTCSASDHKKTKNPLHVLHHSTTPRAKNSGHASTKRRKREEQEEDLIQVIFSI